MSDQKIKFDGMFKMSGRDFEKFLFSAGKVADSQNLGFDVPFLISSTIYDQLLGTFRAILTKYSWYLRNCTDQRKHASTIVTAILEQMKVKDYISAEI